MGGLTAITHVYISLLNQAVVWQPIVVQLGPFGDNVGLIKEENFLFGGFLVSTLNRT